MEFLANTHERKRKWELQIYSKPTGKNCAQLTSYISKTELQTSLNVLSQCSVSALPKLNLKIHKPEISKTNVKKL